jgi:hypothetical protein
VLKSVEQDECIATAPYLYFVMIERDRPIEIFLNEVKICLSLIHRETVKGRHFGFCVLMAVTVKSAVLLDRVILHYARYYSSKEVTILSVITVNMLLLRLLLLLLLLLLL